MESTIVKRDLQEALYAGKFVSVPGDVYTIKSTKGMICNSITVHVANTGDVNAAAIETDEYFTLPNNLDAWKFLKQINEMGGRIVFHQRGDEPPVEYKRSGPYRCRFGKTCGICKENSNVELEFNSDVQLYLCPTCAQGVYDAEVRAEAGHP